MEITSPVLTSNSHVPPIVVSFSMACSQKELDYLKKSDFFWSISLYLLSKGLIPILLKSFHCVGPSPNVAVTLQNNTGLKKEMPMRTKQVGNQTLSKRIPQHNLAAALSVAVINGKCFLCYLIQLKWHLRPNPCQRDAQQNANHAVHKSTFPLFAFKRTKLPCNPIV